MYEEDVFSLYERNRNHYNNYCLSCDDKKNTCPCVSRLTLYPICVGEQEIPCRFRVKNYVKVGDECSICYDPIVHKINTYLTGCGHSFHRKCLADVFIAKWKNKAFSQMKCPLCRCGLGCPDLFQRYDYITGNTLDMLENFWLSKEFLLPEFCSNSTQYSHFLGVKKDCPDCLRYRDTGF